MTHLLLIRQSPSDDVISYVTLEKCSYLLQFITYEHQALSTSSLTYLLLTYANQHGMTSSAMRQYKIAHNSFNIKYTSIKPDAH